MNLMAQQQLLDAMLNMVSTVTFRSEINSINFDVERHKMLFGESKQHDNLWTFMDHEAFHSFFFGCSAVESSRRWTAIKLSLSERGGNFFDKLLPAACSSIVCLN